MYVSPSAGFPGLNNNWVDLLALPIILKLGYCFHYLFVFLLFNKLLIIENLFKAERFVFQFHAL
jgi:hypothetical protein